MMCLALCSFGLLALSIPVHALTNVTVDDTNGDEVTGAQIVYSPASSWNVGQDCTSCTAKINASIPYDGSWHDGTYYPVGAANANNPGEILTAQYTFSGTAIYVYCLLERTSSSPDGNTDMTFFIDGVSSGSFELAPDNDTTIYYNQLVYSKTGLSSGTHNFTIANGLANQKSLVLLDRLVYTMGDTGASTSSSSTSSSSSASSSTSSSSPTTSDSSTSLSGLSSTSVDLSSPTTTTPTSSGVGSASRTSVVVASILGGFVGTLLLSGGL